jgi:hypothetical protein
MVAGEILSEGTWKSCEKNLTLRRSGPVKYSEYSELRFQIPVFGAGNAPGRQIQAGGALSRLEKLSHQLNSIFRPAYTGDTASVAGAAIKLDVAFN